jgi:hypothetical protein
MVRDWKNKNKLIKQKKMMDCNLPPFKYSIVAMFHLNYNKMGEGI